MIGDKNYVVSLMENERLTCLRLFVDCISATKGLTRILEVLHIADGSSKIYKFCLFYLL